METTYLTTEEFHRLPDYSASIPTGTTIGKKWRRYVCHFKDSKGIEFFSDNVPENMKLISEEWRMGEYVPHDDPNLVGIKWTKILIVGKLEVDKLIAKFNERHE
jgi:hypothetical protein